MVSSAILICLAIYLLLLITAHCGIASEFDQRGHLRTGICIKKVNRVDFDFLLTLIIFWPSEFSGFYHWLSFWEMRVCQLWRFWSHYCNTIKLALPLEYLSLFPLTLSHSVHFLSFILGSSCSSSSFFIAIFLSSLCLNQSHFTHLVPLKYISSWNGNHESCFKNQYILTSFLRNLLEAKLWWNVCLYNIF